MGELIKFEESPLGHWEHLKALVLDSVPSPLSKRSYSAALDDYRSWFQTSGVTTPLFSKASVNSFKTALGGRGLSASSINIRLSAIRKLAGEAVDNGLLAPELAAGIARVQGVKKLGRRMGNWLDATQASRFIGMPDATTLTGKRDQALLALLVGAGLRRSEAANVQFSDIQQREGHWCIVDLVGKHGRIRTVPVPSLAKALLDRWATAAGICEGFVFRPLNKAHHLTADRFTAKNSKAIWVAIEKYRELAGIPKLAPHDLRRSFARISRKNGARLEDIQAALGHASVQTTEVYTSIGLDLQHPACDALNLEWPPAA